MHDNAHYNAQLLLCHGQYSNPPQMGITAPFWEKARPESLISRVVVTKNFQLFVPIHPQNASCCMEGE